MLPLPVMVSSPPIPSNSLKVPLLPTLKFAGLVNPVAPKLAAVYMSAKLVPRTDSIERSVSLPMDVSPVTIPVVMLTMIPDVTVLVKVGA